jgi:rhodanese-related sulfurtransferase
MTRFATLTADEFAQAVASDARPFVIDVRRPEEYEAGHVPGSRSIGVHELVARRAELPTSKVTRVLIVGEPGKRSEAAAAWFALMGYVDVALLDGGFAAWTGEVEKGPPPPPKKRGPELRVI